LPICVIILGKGIAIMATMNVSLPDPMKVWVEAQTQDGRYSNASDYVRDLIRRDQDRQQAIAELQQLVDEGLASGPTARLDVEAFLARKREQNARADGC
jgi:antitoxin ParD1/3/4